LNESATRKGCSIIFINQKHQVLLFLRDDIKHIPYPGMWDLPGGHVEPGETPDECIIREMKEELEYDLKEFTFFSETDFQDRIEFTYWKTEEFDLKQTPLHEGQRLRWFSYDEICKINLACCFNRVIDEFFNKQFKFDIP